MGFLVVSKELVRQSLTEPSAERRRKKKPRPAEADRGKEKGGRTPLGFTASRRAERNPQGTA